ncbi:AAA family ATPase [Bernardetia sp. OM2101]|uniref:AAA family ATPase n=1 Tax=Bernardetia sp. OM2101 TaxID=3344876 RepID=UPI0035D041E0
MNIKSIGLENFRLVKDDFFDLSDFVILTGANNSGKSTLLKALLLIAKSFKKFPSLDYLDLKGINPSLGGFKNILTEGSKQKEIAFTLPFDFIIDNFFSCKEQLQIKFTFSNTNSNNKHYPELIKLKIFGENELPILDIKNRKITLSKNPMEDLDASANEQTVFFNYTWYREKLKEVLSETKTNKYKGDSINDIKVFLDDNEYFSDFEKLKNVHHKIANGWLVQDRDFKNGKKNKYTFTESLAWFFEDCFPFGKLNKINSKIDGLDNPEEDTIYIAAETMINQIKEDLFYSLSKLREEFIERICYIEAYRGSIDRLYTYNNESFNRLLSEYIEIELSTKEPEYIFLTKWINNKKFDFGDYRYFEIIPYSDFNANVVLLKKNETDKEGKALADFGYGTLQIFIILLTIALEAKKNRIEKYRLNYTAHTILIEEPEANLHPKWQALLADLFIDSINSFNTQFIIETHSEYLIRRIQYQVASKQITSNQIKIYHFKNKSDITDIKVDDLGNIKTKLGSVFFDEATTLKDEFSQIQKVKELEIKNEKLNSKLKEIEGKNKCVFFTEDEHTELLTNVLKASGFKMEETELYSYLGCSNLSSAKLISEYINGKFPNQKIVIHRDRDYLSLEEVETWEQGLRDVHIYPFITQGTEIECYYLNSKHINHTDGISIEKATEILEITCKEKREESIKNMKKKEYGGNYATKKSDMLKFFENVYDSDEMRYVDSKKVFSTLKQKIKNETTNNAKIFNYSDFLQDDKLKEISNLIWKKTE